MRYFSFTVLLAFFLLPGNSKLFGQNLLQLPPVLKAEKAYSDTSLSFIFTTTDLHHSEFKKPQKYANCLQVFDADVPWPPRWYYAIPFNDSAGKKSGINTLGDARLQQGQFTFYRVKKGGDKNNPFANSIAGYVFCNKKMEAVDTLNSSKNNIIDPHDLRVNDKGERMVMAYLDTVLDISQASGNPADTARSASVTLIEIFDATNHLVFRWNSATVLDANTMYYPDLKTHTYFKQNNMDWSHGTAACWDGDGNILYSFRYIGIGKISRQDGHVMWRVDRRDMPVIRGSDTLEFYAQHDFEALGDTGAYSYYSLFSDGKQPDKLAYALTFKVNKQTNDITLVNKRMTAEPMITDGAGNYEMYGAGNYLLSYGQYPLKDSSENFHPFMELRHKNETIFAKYKLPALVFTYKVHPLSDARPPRPGITTNKKTLEATGDMSEWVWYRLTGVDNTIVQKVSEGYSFTPTEPGVYCVEGKYGIGWAVSKPFLFKPVSNKSK